MFCLLNSDVELVLGGVSKGCHQLVAVTKAVLVRQDVAEAQYRSFELLSALAQRRAMNGTKV